MIGATTLDEYRKYIERDAALERRFQPVLVEEPTIEETIEILQGHQGALRAAPPGRDHRRGDQGRRRAVGRATSPTASCPDKAIDLIDEAASRVRMQRATAPPSLKEAHAELDRVHQGEGRGDHRPAVRAGRRAPRPRGEAARESSSAQRAELAGRRASRRAADGRPRRTSPRSWRCGPASRSPGSPRRSPRACSRWRRRSHARVIGQDEAIGTSPRPSAAPAPA